MDFISAFDRVRDSYVDYVKTAFGTQYPGLEAERERLLREPGTISQEPWIEPIPRYQTSGKKIGDLTAADLPGMTQEEIVAFQALARCGLIGDFELHGHQDGDVEQSSLGYECSGNRRDGLRKNRSVLITSLCLSNPGIIRLEPTGGKVGASGRLVA